MMREYRPRVSNEYELTKLLASFGAMTRTEEEALFRLFAENRVPLEQLRALMSQPRAFAQLLEGVETLRPFVGLREFAAYNYGHKGVLRSWLRADGVRTELLPEMPSSELYGHRFDGLVYALEDELRSLYGRLRLDEGEIPDEGEILARQTVTVPYVSLGGPAAELPHLFQLMRESFANVGLHFGWKPQDQQELLARLEGGVLAKADGFGVDLLRFGVIETSYGEGERTMAELRAKMPPGARPAGLEALAAIAEHPRLLAWMNVDANGGASAAANPVLWLPGLGTFEREGRQPEYLQIATEASGAFRLPRLAGVPWPMPMPTSDDHGRERGFFPYVIPVRTYTPAELGDKSLSPR